MRATCEGCGHRHTAGTVTVWLKRDRTSTPTRILNEPREDVSFRCDGCETDQNMEVEIIA
jgi:hypothetical protein